MSQYIPFLDDPIPGRQPGGIGRNERWWVERQKALEQAGYMLRPRFRPGWQPSWTNTNKHYLDCEDGQIIGVSVDPLPSTACDLIMISAAFRNGRNSNL
jgi:hypothetical protein